MEKTTIQLSKKMKDKLASFGAKHETFENILQRVYNLAVQQQLKDFLMNTEGFISIDEAIKEAEKKWPSK
jgi:hypothetical protein